MQVDFLDSLIQLYKLTDWECHKVQFEEVKHTTKRQSLVFSRRLRAFYGRFRKDELLEIVNLYYQMSRDPIWTRLIKFGSYSKTTTKRFEYDATIDDDNNEALEHGDLFWKSRINKSVSQQLDDVCSELKHLQSDQSSSIYSEIPEAKPKDSEIVGETPNKELYTYI